MILFIAPLIAGLYGVLHDEITYTLSYEYYTKFKFYQFRLAFIGDEAILPNPRSYVALVGFMATWWTGLIIGLIQGLIGFIHPDHKIMFKVVLQSILITLIVTVLTGFAGFIYGKLFLSDPEWYFPNNLIDKPSFVTVGSIHNFGYLGGFLGLITGIVFQFKKRVPSS